MASTGEQLLETGRRNNTELFLQIRGELNDDAKLAELLNTTTEVVTNNSPLHLAAAQGHWEVIDIILDIEGVEIDSQNREGQTPLHLAVKYCHDEFEHGKFIVDNMLDAGADPRIRDKSEKKPAEYGKDLPSELFELLESAEYAIGMEITESEQLNGGEEDDEEDDGEPTDEE